MAVFRNSGTSPLVNEAFMQETKAGAMACRTDYSFNNHVGTGTRLRDLFGEALLILMIPTPCLGRVQCRSAIRTRA